MATYLLTGANRGIGLELTKQLLELPEDQLSLLFTTTRSEPSGALAALIAKSGGRVKNVLAAIDDTASVEKAAREVEAALGPDRGLDVLINNAGISGQPYPDGKLASCPPEEFLSILNTNVVGTHRMTRAFLPLVRKGTQKKIINISSAVGSFAMQDQLYNFVAPIHAYKVSKAALNMVTKIASLDLADEGFTVITLSPGWLETDMGGEHAELPVSVGVAEVKRIILEATPSQNGKFLDINVPGDGDVASHYNGGEIPW